MAVLYSNDGDLDSIYSAAGSLILAGAFFAGDAPWISSIQLRMIYRVARDGSTDNHGTLTLTIRPGSELFNGSSNQGSILATAETVSTTILPTFPYLGSDFSSAELITFQFANDLLSANTQYYAVLDTTEAISGDPDEQDYSMWVTDVTPFANLGTTGNILIWTGSSWGRINTRKFNMIVNGQTMDPALDPAPPPDDLISFPPSRPDAYDPDLIWQPGEWTGPTTYVPGDWGAGYVATGGGRWGQNLVVCGNKKIYYEPHEGV